MEIAIPTFDWSTISVVVPEIVVLVTALLVMVVDLWLPKDRKSPLAWLGLAGVLLAAGISYYMWDGITRSLHGMLVADGYALFLNLVILAVAGLAILLSLDYAGRKGIAQGEFYTLLLLSSAGMMLMAAATDLMTIFLALEILSIALYVLVGLNRAKRRSAEAALKYLLLGAFASGFLLYGMALIYGQAGTTSLAGVRAYATGLGDSAPALLTVGMGLMIVGFGFKLALVPFQMWAPDVYEGAPTPVTAFMSVGAKVAGFAALGRVVLVALGNLQGAWVWVLAVLAAVTMTVGNLAALRQTNLKRMLAYSSIAHAGYVLVGVAAGSELGTSGVLFYLFAYAFMNVAAFAVIIAVGRLRDAPGDGEPLEAFAGLAARKPGLAIAMALSLLSLAGVPPLAGFLGKLAVFSAAVQADLTWLAIAGVVNSVVSAYYYLRVVGTMVRENAPTLSPDEQKTGSPICLALQAGIGLASLAIVVLGIWPAPLMNLARTAASALLGG